MAEPDDRNSVVAIGELRGLLAAFAWVNGKPDHGYTFALEELPSGADVHESLARYFGEHASKVPAVEVRGWREAIGAALHRWLFEYGDLVRPQSKSTCTMMDHQSQREMVDTILHKIEVGLQPFAVWRVEIQPVGFYECDWTDFAIRTVAASYLLHLGVSD